MAIICNLAVFFLLRVSNIVDFPLTDRSSPVSFHEQPVQAGLGGGLFFRTNTSKTSQLFNTMLKSLMASYQLDRL